MIIAHARHGRTRRDARNLAKHLMKPDAGIPPRVHSMVGLAAMGVEAALNAMRRLAPPGAAAFHHISLSPSAEWAAGDLVVAAASVVRELGGDPATHPHVIVLHHKPGAAGRGSLHAHVVVSHWLGPSQRLDDAWSHLRLERLARELEWSHHEPLTRGRHDKAVAKALRARGLPEIADALLTTECVEPVPRSVVTASARQALTRQGIDDVAARSVVTAAWSQGDTPASFRAALAEAGLLVVPGQKQGVWVVQSSGGVVIGALDRIVRQKRGDVVARMEVTDEHYNAAPRTGAFDPHPEGRQQDRDLAPPTRFAGGSGGADTVGSDPRGPNGHPGGAAEHPRQPAPHRAGDPASARRRVRDRAAATALASAISMPEIKAEVERRYLQRRLDELREVHDAAREKLALARVPLPMPDSLIQARLRADRARQASRATRDAMHAASARLDAIKAAEPRGFAVLAAWIGGRARRLRQEAAEAAEDDRRARERHEDANRLSGVFQAALEAEAERVSAKRVQAVAARRQLAEVAEHEVAVVVLAANSLRTNPLLGLVDKA